MTLMSQVKCCICGKGLTEGLSVYRVNAKGVPGIWACKQHLSQTDAKPDPEGVAIVEALERAGRTDQ